MKTVRQVLGELMPHPINARMGKAIRLPVAQGREGSCGGRRPAPSRALAWAAGPTVFCTTSLGVSSSVCTRWTQRTGCSPTTDPQQEALSLHAAGAPCTDRESRAQRDHHRAALQASWPGGDAPSQHPRTGMQLPTNPKASTSAPPPAARVAQSRPMRLLCITTWVPVLCQWANGCEDPQSAGDRAGL